MENRFIMSYFNNSKSYSEENFTSNFVDKENKIARITTFMKDISTNRIEEIEKTSHISRNLPITDLRQPT